ncbi:lytic transglycosylase domain-containing protein [Thioalkalicoccus limnaeus]|uniref:Lytic transglycosylase domain-containing protein n=1 Tax=Thioalkalicoccus limnaeus TaxID=120681 RepID=A0ABV4B9W7_9GAMM
MASARALLAILSCLTVGTAAADVYKYVDAQGGVIFTDKPLTRQGVTLEWRRSTTSLTAEHQESAQRVLAQARVLSSAPAKLGRTAAQRRADFDPMIRANAARYRLSPELLHAVIRAESAYNPAAVSPAGATGLMQLMPATAERYRVRDIWDPAENLRGGAEYLRYLLDLFDQDLRLALAGYNAGENAVIRHGRQIPPFAETQTYVRRVLQFMWAEQASSGRIAMR